MNVVLGSSPIPSTIISKSSSGWSVLNQGTDPALTDADFNSTWFNPTIGGYTGGSYGGPAFTTSQTAPFRYGSIEAFSEPTTVLANKVTTYFDKVIDGGATGYASLALSMLADDGAFVYLNGVLIAQYNIAAPDTYSQDANGFIDESVYSPVPLLGSPELNPGPNLIAVSLHNKNSDSTDIGFDIELAGYPILVIEDSTGWGFLNPIDPSNGDGYDPVVGHATQAADTDFNITWSNQNFGNYSGVVYDGPSFTTEQQGPFAYGTIDGIPSPNTTLSTPNTGTRHTAYFIKEFNGGATGFDQATFTVLADDGAYIYLNGNLVGVIGNLPNDVNQDTWSQLASTWQGTEDTFHTLTVSGDQIIQPGFNLLAVSVHQQLANSTDLGLSIKLTAQDVEPPMIVRGPYLQSESHDRMTIKWRTDYNSDSVLRYGDAPENLTQTTSITENVTDHTVTLTGLIPATQYFYQIESTTIIGSDTAGADANHYFKTHPSPGARSPARIWVIGDSGTTSTAKMDVYNAYLTRTGSTHTDAWLMLGDNAYNSGTDSEYQVAVFDSYSALLRNTVLWSCRGNHEADYGNDTVYTDIHHFPTAGECGGVASNTEIYYSFDHGNIHFVCLNTSGPGDIDDFPGNGGMIDWLEMDLKATDKDWIIAYMHHGPYTKGSHDSDTEHSHVKARRYMTPLLERYGVDLVLAGHSHSYERSMLINGHHSNMSTGDSTSSNFVIGVHGVDTGNGSTLGSVDASGDFLTSGASDSYEKPLATGAAGTVYSTVGASGKLGSWDDGSNNTVNPAPHPVFIVNLRVMGSMLINVDGNSLNAQYVDHNNVIRDDFTIIKGSTVQVTATDDSFGEFGADDTASFTLIRTGATSLAETVNYTISGSATIGSDFTPILTGSVSFLAGETAKVMIVTRVADQLAEGEESLSATLVAAQQMAEAGGALRDKYFLGTNASDTATLADSPSQLWWFNNFGAATLNQTLWESDTDNDGLARLMEYALGGTVGSNDTGRLPTHLLSGNAFELHYQKNNALTDITYTVVTSTDLSAPDWTTEAVTTVLNGPANPTGVESYQASVDMVPEQPRRFLRLLITPLSP
jgi:hypothetical protein